MVEKGRQQEDKISSRKIDESTADDLKASGMVQFEFDRHASARNISIKVCQIRERSADGQRRKAVVQHIGSLSELELPAGGVCEWRR